LLLPVAAAARSVSLIDDSAFEFLINSSVVPTNAAEASGAAIRGSGYTQAVAASTAGGGTVSAVLADAFDGYYGLLVNGTPYQGNGAARITECPGPVTGLHRQLVFNLQTIGGLDVFRKVFVPDNDAFARWLDFVTNTGSTTASVELSTATDLYPELDTVVTATSDGDTTVALADTWFATAGPFGPDGTAVDVRLGHVVQGAGARVPIGAFTLAGGRPDRPSWSHAFDLAPGETAIVMTFVTGQASRAAAAAKAAELSFLPTTALQCLTDDDPPRIVNFGAPVGRAAFALRSGDDRLFRLFLETGLVQPIGSTGVAGIEALALASDGTLYAVDAAADRLLTLDRASGAPAPVGPLGADVAGVTLTADGAGSLWMAGDGGFYAVDPRTGGATRIADQDLALSGLAAGCTGVLGLRSGADAELVRIEPSSGVATPIGPLAGVAGDAGLAYDAQGALWSVTAAGPIYTVDSLTPGAARTASTAPLAGLRAAAIAPLGVSPAQVGKPQIIPLFGTTAGLAGNLPTVGTGSWSLVSGGAGTFQPDAGAPNATFTHSAGSGPIVLRWTIAAGTCAARSADVTVTLAAEPLMVARARIRLDFKRQGRDRMTWRGSVPVAAGFSPAGQTVQVDLGGVQRTFTLDARGRARSGPDRFRLRLKRRAGVIVRQNAKFTLAVRGDLSDQLADEGLTGEAGIGRPGVPRTVLALLRLGETGLLKTQSFRYTVRVRRAGTAKSRP
jgi:hypothetical protein